MGHDRDAAKITAVRQVSAGQAFARPPSGRTSPLSWLISGSLFAAFGFVFSTIGLIMIVRQRAYVAEARPAKATIVEPVGPISHSYKNDGPPRFEFRDGAGKIWRVEASSSEKEIDYKVGQTVDIYYPPAHPDQAIMADFDGLWSLPIFMMVISIVPIWTGLWTALIGWRGMRDARASG